MEWEKWWDLFGVALMAKYSSSVAKLNRIPTNDNPRNQALLGGMQDKQAERKVVGVLFLSLGPAARKNLIDRFAELTVATVQLPNLTNQFKGDIREATNQKARSVQFW